MAPMNTPNRGRNTAATHRRPAQTSSLAGISGTEKANTGVGRGINMLTATCIAKDQLSTYKLFDMDKLAVESMSENFTYTDVYTENSKVELAKSLSVSAGAEASYMLFSASVSTGYSSSANSSEEKAYTRLITKVKKKRHYFPDDSFKKYLLPAFSADLNGNMEPAQIFRTYGTHIVREAGIGGVLNMNLTTTKTSNESKESLSISVKASFGKIASGSVDTDTQSSFKSLLERSEYSYRSVGGKNLRSLNLENFFVEYPSWIQSVSDDPSSWEFGYLPNDNSLVPIWELASSAARRRQIKDEFERQAAQIQSALVSAETFVSDILITSDGKKPNARSAPAGYNLVDRDLNEGAGGDFIYLSYRTMTQGQLSSSGRLPITNLMMVQYDKPQTWTTAYSNDGNGRRALYYRINVDLNKGAGGRYVYLLYTYDKQYAPLVALDAYTDNNRPTSNEWDTVTWNDTFAIADVNKGAGGKYIYILLKHKR